MDPNDVDGCGNNPFWSISKGVMVVVFMSLFA